MTTSHLRSDVWLLGPCWYWYLERSRRPCWRKNVTEGELQGFKSRAIPILLSFASHVRFKMCALSCCRNPRCALSTVAAIISDTLDSCNHKSNKPFLLQAALVLVFHHGIEPLPKDRRLKDPLYFCGIRMTTKDFHKPPNQVTTIRPAWTHRGRSRTSYLKSGLCRNTQAGWVWAWPDFPLRQNTGERRWGLTHSCQKDRQLRA